MLKIRTACESDLPQIMLIEKLSFAPQIQESQNVFLERMKLCPKMFLIFYEADQDGQPEISPFESNRNNENNGNNKIMEMLQGICVLKFYMEFRKIKMN